MSNRSFVFIFLVVCLLSFSFVSAGEAPQGHIILNDSNLGQQIVLTEDVNIANYYGYYQYLSSSSLGATNYIDINCNGYDVYGPTNGEMSYFFDNNSDLNVLILRDCNINLTNAHQFFILPDAGFNYIYVYDSNFEFGTNGIFFTQAGQDNYLKFYFDNVIADRLLFEDLNLLITTFVGPNESGLGDGFVSISGNSEIEHIDFNNSIIDMNDGTFIILNTNSNILDVNYFDLNMVRENLQFINFNSNIDTLQISNYTRNFASNTSSLLISIGSDVNNFNLINSDININCNSFFTFGGGNTGNLDMNFYGTNITKNNTGCNSDNKTIFSFTDYNFGLNDFTSFDVYNLDVNYNGDGNLFYLSNVNIGSLNITDSYFKVSGLFDINSDSNIQSGAIYNNRFDINLADESSQFVYADAGAFNLDFNTSLNTDNAAKRDLWITDDVANTGGNLWWDIDSNSNICTVLSIPDNDEPYGICDLNVEIGTGNYDNYPLIYSDYTPPNSAYSLDDSNLGTTFTLTDDVISSNDIFLDLNVSGDGNSFTLDCNGFSITSNTVEFILFETNDNALDTITIQNCDINLSVVDGLVFDIQGDVNYVNILDSNVIISSSTLLNIYQVSDYNLDVNLFGSNISGGYNYEIFAIGDANLEYLNIYDLNFSETDTTQYSFLGIDVDVSTVDINNIYFYDSNLNFSLGGSFSNLNNIQDNYLKFIFDNTDANYLMFEDLNVNILDFVTESMDPYAVDAIFTIKNNSDINYVDFNNSDINILDGHVINLFTLDDSSIIFDLNNLNLSAPSTMSSTELFYMIDANYDSITLQNLSSNMLSSMSIFTLIGCDLNTINIFDSSFRLNGNLFSFFAQTSSLDLNFFGSSFSRISSAGDGFFYFDFYDGVANNSLNTLSIFNLELTTDRNVFVFDDSNIINLVLTDSNLNIDSFAYLDENSYITNGSIYNNQIYDSNLTNTFVYAPLDQFEVDFNTISGQNASIRHKWFSDDSNAIGGNLWLDSEGSNLCSANSSTYPGICSDEIELIGSDENYYDYLPLIEYIAYPDLKAFEIQLPKTTYSLGESVDFNFIYGNIGQAIAIEDYNLIYSVCFENSYPTMCYLNFYTETVYNDLNVDQNGMSQFSSNFEGGLPPGVPLQFYAEINYFGTDSNADNNLVASEVFTILDPSIDLNVGADYNINSNISGWASSYFKITADDDDNFVNINCAEGVTIDNNYSSDGFISIDGNIQTLTINNCDFSIQDINDYQFITISGLVKKINLINSNITVDSNTYNSHYIYAEDIPVDITTLDLNFSQSYIDSNARFGLSFYRSDVNELNIYDLNYLSYSNQLSYFIFAYSEMGSESEYTRINKINMIDSYYEYNLTSSMNSGIEFMNLDLEAVSTFDLNFVATRLKFTTVGGPQNVIQLYDLNADTINIYGLDMNIYDSNNGSQNAIYLNNVKTNQLNIVDTNITQNSGASLALVGYRAGYSLDVNCVNTNFIDNSSTGINRYIYLNTRMSDLTIHGLNIFGNSSSDSSFIEVFADFSYDSLNDLNVYDIYATNLDDVLYFVPSATREITNFNIFHSSFSYKDKLIYFPMGSSVFDSNIHIFNNYFQKTGASQYDVNMINLTTYSYNFDSLDFNTALTSGTNIINAPYIGGNYWTNSDNNGLSDTCTDNGYGVCTTTKTISDGSHTYYDYLPLTEFSSITVSGCMDIYDANTVGDIILDSNIDGFDGNCFELQEDITNPLEINCGNNFIDINTESSILLNTNGYNVDSITLDNCDINVFALNAKVLNIDSNIETIIASESNIYLNNGYFVFINSLVNESLDFNLDTSYFEASNLGQLIEFDSSSVSELNLYDLNFISQGLGLIVLSSDVNAITILNSNIITNGGVLRLNYVNNDDVDVNFYGSDLNLYGGECFHFDNSNINELSIFDLNADTSSLYGLIYSENGDIPKLSLINSNIDDTIILYSAYAGNSKDLNFYNSHFNVGTSGTGQFLYFEGLLGDLNISNLDVNAETLITVGNSESNFVLNIVDSNLELDELIYLIDTNITSGLIYNNIITDWNYDNNFINLEGVSIFNADLNSSISSNSTKRLQLGLNDDSKYISGNVWYDLEGSNLCSANSSTYPGICNSGVELIGSDKNYYDYGALIEYVIPTTIVNSCPGLLTDANLGRKFILDNDVNITERCFDLTNVNSDNNFLIVDCNGYTIEDSVSISNFIYLDNTSLDYIQVKNCNVINEDWPRNYLRLLSMTNNSDVNELKYFDNNVNIYNRFDHYLFYIFDTNMSEFNIDLSGTKINYYSDMSLFYFWNNTGLNINTITISNLDVNAPSMTNGSIINLLSGWNEYSYDVNNINIINSDINTVGTVVGFLSYNWFNKLDSLDLNFFGSNIYGYNNAIVSISPIGISEINIYNLSADYYGDDAVLYLDNGHSWQRPLNYDAINFYNLDVNVNSGEFLGFHIFDVVQDNLSIDLVNSIIDVSNISQDILFDGSVIQNIDFNIYNSNIYGWDINGVSSISDNLFNIVDSNIYGLDINTFDIDANKLFYISNSYISDLNLNGSELTIDTLFDSSNSNISGLIYNNGIIDTNTLNEIVINDELSTFNLDFNIPKTLGTNVARKDYLGGNYWTNMDNNGYSDICGRDWNSAETDNDRDGLCNTPYNVFTTDVNHYDYLPLDIPGSICGVLDGDVTFSFDLEDWQDTCFTLTEGLQNLTIDCNGYTIQGGGDSSIVLDLNADLNSITFRHCNTDFETDKLVTLIYGLTTGTLDLNYINVLDSNINLTQGANLFKIPGNGQILTKDALTFNLAGTNIEKTNNNTFTDAVFNLNSNAVRLNTINIFDGNFLMNSNQSSDYLMYINLASIDRLNFINNTVYQYANKLFYIINQTAYEDFDMNFYKSQINVMSSSNAEDMLFQFAYSVGDVTINKLSVDATSTNIAENTIGDPLIDFYYNVNSFTLIDSNILWNNAASSDYRPRSIFKISVSANDTSELDVNFYNSNIELFGNTSIISVWNGVLEDLNFVGNTVFELSEGANAIFFAMPDENFNVSNLEIISPDNTSTLLFSKAMASNTDVGFYLQNSNIQVGRLFNFDSSAQWPATLSGLIYNNIIDINADWNNYAGTDAIVDLDLNTALQEGTNILGNEYIGGNYWADQNCQDVNTTTLICNEPYTIHFTNSLYDLNDYLPLGQSSVDLAASGISISGNQVWGNDLNITFAFRNVSEDANVLSTEYDINYYYIKDSVETNISSQEDGNLIFGSSSSKSYVWTISDASAIGDINVCAKTIYSGDANSNNDSNCVFASIKYRDVSANTIQLSNYTPTYGDTNLDINVYVTNLGDYNSNDFNVYLYAISDTNTSNTITKSWTLQDVNASATLRLNTSWLPNTMLGDVDFNLVVVPLETDYNSTNNYKFFDNNANVKYVDLNTTIGSIADVNAGHGVDVNCTVYNIGTASATSSYDINLLVDGVTVDYNTITADLSAGNSHIETLTWTPDAKANNYNVGCVVTYSGTDYNSNNDSQYIDKNVGADSLVDLSALDISLSSTVAGAVTVTCDINNIGDENATSDYNVKLYVDDVLLSSNDINTQLNVNSETSTTFSWTSTAGTHSLECVADYNVNNYTGYDANISNNSYSESFTITSGTTAPSGGGGGGGSSDKTEITKDVTLGTDGLSGRASFSNSDNDGIDNVSFVFKEETKSALTLTLNTDPELTASDFKVIYGEDVINYMQFTYSGDQSVLENVSIKFSLPKTKSKDPNTIRLARLESGVWKYYVPTFEDKGTYYQFTVVVPGFSYFAIVNYKEATINTTIDQNTNNNSNTNNTNNTNNNNNNVVDNSNTTDNNTTEIISNNNVVKNDDISGKNKSSSYTFVGVILGIILVAVLVWLVSHFMHKPKNIVYNFKPN